MYVYFLYIILIVFLGVVLVKTDKHKSEWMLLLIILSFLKTCVTYLFAGTTVFCVAVVGNMQIHLDDIILFLLFTYCVFKALKPIKKSWILGSTLLMLIPMVISVIRGILSGTIGSSTFLSDTRKFIIFLVSIYSFYFLLSRPTSQQQLWKYVSYINTLMNIMLLYIIITWILDRVCGINYLPGQIGGTLSDGGSTFRIIPPPQSLVIALYTLYEMYKDLSKRQIVSFRTIIFAMVVVLMQWRTVVATFLIGVLMVITLEAKRKELSLKLFGQVLLITILLIIFIRTISDSYGILEMLNNLFSSFGSVVENTGTYSTRTDIWRLMISSLSGINIILGRPFGQSLGISWTASAHNGYVDYIMKMGYLGVIMMFIFMIFIIIKSFRIKQYIIGILLSLLLVFWYGYGFSIEQGAFIGICIALLENNNQKVVNQKKGESYEEENNICLSLHCF